MCHSLTDFVIFFLVFHKIVVAFGIGILGLITKDTMQACCRDLKRKDL